jgi:hypothetical protein
MNRLLSYLAVVAIHCTATISYASDSLCKKYETVLFDGELSKSTEIEKFEATGQRLSICNGFGGSLNLRTGDPKGRISEFSFNSDFLLEVDRTESVSSSLKLGINYKLKFEQPNLTVELEFFLGSPALGNSDVATLSVTQKGKSRTFFVKVAESDSFNTYIIQFISPPVKIRSR